MSATWRARWFLDDGRPIPPIHAVDHLGAAACDPGLIPDGRPADGDVHWQGNEVGACKVCLRITVAGSVANPRRVKR